MLLYCAYKLLGSALVMSASIVGSTGLTALAFKYFSYSTGIASIHILWLVVLVVVSILGFYLGHYLLTYDDRRSHFHDGGTVVPFLNAKGLLT